MKFAAVLVFVGILAVALGARPTPPRKCDFRCTKLDMGICAHNGMCFNYFPSLCKMEEYNCLFPQKTFNRTEDWMCAERFLPQCTPGDF